MKLQVAALSQTELTLRHLRDDDTVVSEVRLDVDDVLKLIQLLSSVRERMVPPVPRQMPEGVLRGVAFGPAFSVRDFDGGQTLLALRHPGLDWVFFALPQSECQLMASGLLRQVP